MGGRFRKKGIYVYLWLTHVVQQKRTQHCKAITLLFFILKETKKRKNKNTILILLIHEHNISFHLFVSPPTSLMNLMVFHVQVFDFLRKVYSPVGELRQRQRSG